MAAAQRSPGCSWRSSGGFRQPESPSHSADCGSMWLKQPAAVLNGCGFPGLMRTDCLFAHKVRSQQGVVKPFSSHFRAVQRRVSIPCSAVSLKIWTTRVALIGLRSALRTDKFRLNTVKTSYIFTYYTGLCGHLQVLSESKKIPSLIILRIFITS